jgi:hypothetical protein
MSYADAPTIPHYSDTEEHPSFPKLDWRYEIANDDTRLGYDDWVASKIESRTNDVLILARNDGITAGVNAAEWHIQDLWGGRATRGEKEAARKFLDGYRDGDPVVIDAFKLPNLSGEWAGDETPQSLMAKLFTETELEDEDVQDLQEEICTAWEEACTEAFYNALEKSAISVCEGGVA